MFDIKYILYLFHSQNNAFVLLNISRKTKNSFCVHVESSINLFVNIPQTDNNTMLLQQLYSVLFYDLPRKRQLTVFLCSTGHWLLGLVNLVLLDQLPNQPVCTFTARGLSNRYFPRLSFSLFISFFNLQGKSKTSLRSFRFFRFPC